MKCYNRNSGEYQELYKKYGSYLKTDMLIDEYQTVHKTDIVPTIQDIAQLQKNKNSQFNFGKYVKPKNNEDYEALWKTF